jgi:hypothetical protein
VELEPAAAFGTDIALLRLAEIGETRLVVATCLHAAQVPAVAIGTGDELALRSISSATTRPSKPTGSEPPPAPKAARISSSSAGRDAPARRRKLRLAEPDRHRG